MTLPLSSTAIADEVLTTYTTIAYVPVLRGTSVPASVRIWYIPPPPPENSIYANRHIRWTLPWPLFVPPQPNPYKNLDYFIHPHNSEPNQTTSGPHPPPPVYNPRTPLTRQPFKGQPAAVEYSDDDVEHRAQIARTANLALAGKINATATLTLTAGATTTAFTDKRIGVTSHLAFMPTTANAAAIVASIFVTNQLDGTATINHTSTANVDQTFSILIIN